MQDDYYFGEDVVGDGANDVAFVIVCTTMTIGVHYRNLNLGLATKARVCKVVGQEGSLGITSHAPRNAKDSEGVNLHTPKWIPILEV